jgi:hypothetical protein
MKTALKIFFAGLLVTIVAGVGWTFFRVQQVRSTVREKQAELASDSSRYEARIRADAARWENDPLLTTHAGPDAAELLFKHIGWDSGGPAAEAIPAELAAKVKALDKDWASHFDGLDLKAVDTGWMAELSKLGFWDLEGSGSALAGKPYMALVDDAPRFVDAIVFGKLRMIRGLQSGDAREAAKETRELARLCASTESLVGLATAGALLRVERRAQEAAGELGQPVEGWTPVSADDASALQRLVWAAPAPYSMLATGALPSGPTFGRCMGLAEGLRSALYMRRFAEREFPDHYAALTAALAQEQCRLRRARQAWADPNAEGQLGMDGHVFCQVAMDDPTPDCSVPATAVKAPFVAPYIGLTLALVSLPDWYKEYRSP